MADNKRARERTSGEEEEPASAAVGARTSGEDQAEAPAASAAAVAAEDDEGPLCRYCFEGESEGELLSPCDCKGGQKWVHLHCLRRWQRMVLVSQPTHPAFYTSDARHHTCGVCAAPFTCAPPTRHELMSSFTGPELGALVDAGCMIGAHAGFSAELSRSLGSMSEYVAEESSYRHWIGGAYLITETAAATPDLTFSLQSREDIALLCSNLGEGDAFQGPRGALLSGLAGGPPARCLSSFPRTLIGVTLRLAARGALSPPPEGEEAAGETVRGRLARLEQRALVEPGAVLPLDVTLLKEPAPDCGEDHITAVNLTRIVPQPSLRMARPVEAAKEALAQRFPQVGPSPTPRYLNPPSPYPTVPEPIDPAGRSVARARAALPRRPVRLRRGCLLHRDGRWLRWLERLERGRGNHRRVGARIQPRHATIHRAGRVRVRTARPARRARRAPRPERRAGHRPPLRREQPPLAGPARRRRWQGAQAGESAAAE